MLIQVKNTGSFFGGKSPGILRDYNFFMNYFNKLAFEAISRIPQL
jgi:hypothetical protein